MKNKLFSRGLYVEGLRQLKLAGIIFLAIFLLIGLAVPILSYVDYLTYASRFVGDTGYEYTPQVVNFIEMCTAVVVIAVVCAPVFTFKIFSQFNKRSASDFYHSLPYTRQCMFISFSSAIFTWLIGLAVIYCGLTIVTFALMPQVFIINLVGMWDILLSCLAIAMMLVFAIICAMSLTGTFLANITCTGLILFLPRLILTLVTVVMAELAPIIEGHYGIFSPEYNIVANSALQIFYGYSNASLISDNIAADIYSICLSLVYAAGAMYLFCIRKSETASHPAPGKTTQHVIRICVGFVISSIVTCAVISGLEISVGIVFYLVALIAYFAYELITQKSFRTLSKTLPGVVILVALNVAIVIACYGGAAYVHSYSPSDDDVQAIYINEAYGYDYTNTVGIGEYVSEKAGQIKIKDRKAIAIATENLRENVRRSENGAFYPYSEHWGDYDESREYLELHITYFAKNGVGKTRNIYISHSDYVALMGSVKTNEEYKEKFREVPEPIRRTITIRDCHTYRDCSFSDDERYEIFCSFKAEAAALDFEQWSEYIADSYYCYENSFEMQYKLANESRTIRIVFNKDYFPKTAKLIMDKVNEAAGDEIEKFYEVISDYEKALEDFEYIYINLFATDRGDNYVWSLYQHYYRDEVKDSEIDDALFTDLKRLAEGMKKETLDGEKYVIVSFNYEADLDGDGETTGYDGTFFLPLPENFRPESECFDIVDYEYDEIKPGYDKYIVIE